MWSNFKPLIGIFSQRVGPSFTIRATPAQFSLPHPALPPPSQARPLLLGLDREGAVDAARAAAVRAGAVARPWRSPPRIGSAANRFRVGLLCGRAGRLTTRNGGLRRVQDAGGRDGPLLRQAALWAGWRRAAGEVGPALRTKVVQGWPNLWANFRALIRIFSQIFGPSLAVWVDPVQFSFSGHSGSEVQ